MTILDIDYDDVGFTFLALMSALTLYTTTLDPFGKLNRVKKMYQTHFEGDEIRLMTHNEPQVRTGIVWSVFARYICIWHIVSNVRGGRRARGKTLHSIIRDIHRLRFDPKKPYLISGDHFNVLYPRNLGVFYYATLDPRTALSVRDWEDRERMYLQSVAFALAVFKKNGDCTTTIVPVGRRAFSCINIYRYPSDSLYGILYALARLIDNSAFETLYSTQHRDTFKLHTQAAARELVHEHRDLLSRLYQNYYGHVFDQKRGLVRGDKAISSAKDAALRESSFYDNVIFWKTCALARELGVDALPELDLNQLKDRILKTFWSEDVGHFLDDDSHEARAGNFYSADWLAAFFTGFLDPHNADDRRYLMRAVQFTIESGLDTPFPLCYQETNRPRNEVFLVRMIVPSYGGSAIWSFWGSEFIKLLLILATYEGGESFLERAQKHIEAYEKNIVKYHGYPEVYNPKGKILRSPLYRSVRQTGWVVGFEQAQAMLRSFLEQRAEGNARAARAQ